MSNWLTYPLHQGVKGLRQTAERYRLLYGVSPTDLLLPPNYTPDADLLTAAKALRLRTIHDELVFDGEVWVGIALPSPTEGETPDG